jgi:hypothetical protein
MALDSTVAREYLKESDFGALFIQALGWDHYRAPPREVLVDDRPFTLRAVAEKRGVQIFECGPDATGTLADYPARRKIEKQVAQWAYEHLVIFTDSGRRTQVWQWVLRQPGRPAACREHTYCTGQPGDALIQKLERITFPLSAEEGLTLSGVTVRLRDAFDKDRVTKRFYERFKTEHAAFLSFVKGIPVAADREWYASLMLNRLMFVYFIEKKGFLDGDTAYLRNRLRMMRERKGKDKFLSFYRHFLLRLFHEGLGQQKRDSDLDQLLGKVPYLDGGLFDVHQLERDNPEIRIADAAFEKLFDFFDAYQWHLDDRPLAADNEINPDVLGYIFEKYVNQKQMGAYYTKEDITGYIAQNTVIPFLFDAAEKKCAIAFRPDGAVWGLLRQDPDRYIYEAVRKGVDVPLPEEIVAGLDDVPKREGWNRPAAAEFALPTETWREHVARRRRCHEVRSKLCCSGDLQVATQPDPTHSREHGDLKVAATGGVHSINDLITLNLDIRQFAQDVIQNCEGPELLRAFHKSMENVSVLDPTCGSGAFLFAALNVLEPLYEACLHRMQAFVDDLDRSGQKHRPEKFRDFREVLERVNTHPNRTYFILKSIIIGNLFGVDIMEEAVEICKLRLFLKLVAQVERVEDIEPLPDIDFNIRAGNTLVGFATYEDVKRAVSSKLDFDNPLQRIDESAEYADRAFQQFRDMQVERGMDAGQFAGAKTKVREGLKELAAELDRYLATEYAIDPDNKAAFERWRASHQPFHWFVDFYGIMKSGGFDVIIGNPPYVELSAITDYRVRGYECEVAGNLYALVLERCLILGAARGRQGFIVPVSSVSTDRYRSLQKLITGRDLHYCSFDDRPSRLFEGLEHVRLTIHLLAAATNGCRWCSTRYNKWNSVERDSLFERLRFALSAPVLVDGSLPKLSCELEEGVLRRLEAQKANLGAFCAKNDRHRVFYSRKVGYFLQALDFEPEVLDGKGRRRPPSEFKELCLRSQSQADVVLCCLNSSLFYWFITVFSDCRHVNKREVLLFPVDVDKVANGPQALELAKLARNLMEELRATSETRVMAFKHDTLTVQCIIPKQAKGLMDQIDGVLARHYGFTDEELDFIINYDIKYRMGQEAEEGEE